MRTVLTISDKGIVQGAVDEAADAIVNKMGFKQESLSNTDLSNIDNIIEDKDASLVIIGIANNSRIQKYLNLFREIRIPYIFLKENQHFTIKQIILPITNLLEEKEKGPFASSFARFFNSAIKIYKPNDYGSGAQNNIDAIASLFNSFELEYSIVNGKKNSYNIELEAILKEKDNQDIFAIITASRDYGLDDIIWGPKERKIIKKATMPIMLINPRGDLYALCE